MKAIKNLLAAIAIFFFISPRLPAAACANNSELKEIKLEEISLEGIKKEPTILFSWGAKKQREAFKLYPLLLEPYNGTSLLRKALEKESEKTARIIMQFLKKNRQIKEKVISFEKEQPSSLFHLTAHSAKLIHLIKNLADKSDINKKNEKRLTPLEHAVMAGNIESIVCLLKMGAYPRISDGKNRWRYPHTENEEIKSFFDLIERCTKKQPLREDHNIINNFTFKKYCSVIAHTRVSEDYPLIIQIAADHKRFKLLRAFIKWGSIQKEVREEFLKNKEIRRHIKIGKEKILPFKTKAARSKIKIKNKDLYVEESILLS